MMRGTVLISVVGLVGMLALSGCGHHQGHGYGHGHGDMEAAAKRGVHEMEELVDKTVSDPAKAATVKGLVGEIVQEVKHSYTTKREHHRLLYTLNANYNATPEDFTKILDSSHNEVMRSAMKIVGLRFKIKEQLTAEEWKAFTDGMDRYGKRYDKE